MVKITKKISIKIHGVIGVIAIVAMIGIGVHKSWDIPWLYVVAACLMYSLVVIFAEGEDLSTTQVLWGSHLSFSLLAGGLLIKAEGFWAYAAIFVSAIALGMAIPFMVVKRD